jgi:hypothetical protein
MECIVGVVAVRACWYLALVSGASSRRACGYKQSGY